MQSIGKSSEGRDIWALKISDNAHLTEPDEPKVLFNSMHHARELMTPEASLDIIETLLSKYHSNKTVTHWVDANEIWVVPMLNVDGNAKVCSGSTMWRKNTNHGHGVDINRNYPYKWNSCNGSSGAIWSSTYRGASGGSGPETQALMNLVKATRPVFSISYHSYSQIVLYPQGCKGERSFNTEVVEKIGHQIAEKIGYTAGTPWELLYSVDGGDIDWMHAEYQVIPYVLELNSSREGFQPNYQMWRDKTTERSRGGWQLLLERLDGPGVRGRLNVGDYIVKVMRDGLTITTYSGNVDGTFHIVLDPGEYELNFSSNQFENFKKVVIIEDKRIDL